MKNVIRLFIVASVAFTAVSGAMAQGGPGQGGAGRQGGGQQGGMRMGQGGGVLQLLMLPVVQKDLNLTNEQINGVKELAAEIQNQMQGLQQRRQAGEEFDMREEATRIQGISEAGVKQILDDKQEARVKQLQLQQAGVRAIARPEIANALGLSSSQKTEIQNLMTAYNAAMQALRPQRGGQGGQRTQPTAEERQAQQEKLKALDEKLDKGLMDVLTAEQKIKFDDMQGKKLDLPKQNGGRGQAGGRGGNGGPGAGPGGPGAGAGPRF